MSRPPVWIVTAALLLSPAPPSVKRAADDGDLGHRLGQAIEVEVANGFAGAVVVTRGSATLLDRAYGSVRGVTIGADTRFWIASAGKQFTSAAILKCQEAGKLTLDDPIAKFFPAAPADKRAITIRHLLAHLSGLDQSYVSEGLADRETAVERMLNEPLGGVPGKKFSYSNNNYQLAVAIVEIASGKPYRQFVHGDLWRAAGLEASGFAGEPGAANVAPARSETPARLARTEWGGEGVFSTTHDLSRWYRALRAGRVLSAASVEQLFQPVTPIGGGQSALGWFLGQTKRNHPFIFTRGNDDWGPNSLLYAYPEQDVVIVVLTHAGDSNEDLSWSRFVHRKIETILGL